MNIHMISGKNTSAELHSMETAHPIPYDQSEDIFMGQRIMIEKEEYLLLTHRKTQYSIAVKIESGTSQFDLENQILNASYCAISREGIQDDIARKFLSINQGITYYDLNNKMDEMSMKAKAKILKEMMKNAGDKRYLKNLIQKNINRIPMKKGKNLIVPARLLITYLEARFERPVIDQKAYEFSFHFRSREENHAVIMSIPEWFPTCQLHEVIGFLLGFDIDEYWMNDYEHIISYSIHDTMSSFLSEKEHMFVSNEKAYTIRNQKELTDFLSKYLPVRELERQVILYDFGASTKDFQIRVEKGEHLEKISCRGPRILEMITAHQQYSSTSEKVLSLNRELKLYYE